MNDISRLEHARSLRRMLAASTLSGAYAPIAALGSTIYTGLALYMGLGSAQIAFMFTAVAAAGLVFMVSQAVISRVKHQKRFLLGCGVVEVLLACAPPLIVVVFPGNQGRFVSLLVLAVVASSLANLRSPLHTSWLSHFLPEPIRARFIGRQSIYATVASMLVGFVVGRFVDTTGRTMVSFAVPYAVALVFGLGVYVILSRLPFPYRVKVQPGSRISATILTPLRNKPFRALLLFNLSLALGENIFGPFSGYYVLREIGQTYSYIAIQGIVASLVAILSYGFWGRIIAKVGGRRIIPLTLDFPCYEEPHLAYRRDRPEKADKPLNPQQTLRPAGKNFTFICRHKRTCHELLTSEIIGQEYSDPFKAKTRSRKPQLK